MPTENVKNSRLGVHLETTRAIEEIIAPEIDTGLAPKTETNALAIGPGHFSFISKIIFHHSNKCVLTNTENNSWQ